MFAFLFPILSSRWIYMFLNKEGKKKKKTKEKEDKEEEEEIDEK